MSNPANRRSERLTPASAETLEGMAVLPEAADVKAMTCGRPGSCRSAASSRPMKVDQSPEGGAETSGRAARAARIIFNSRNISAHSLQMRR